VIKKTNFMIKTVITGGGKGTRLLPITKEIPKEMMPIFATYRNKKITIPLLQFIFEQLYNLKIRNFGFVIGSDKKIIKNHFIADYNYLEKLPKNYKNLIKNHYKKIEKCDFTWINQKKPLGFGDAVLKTEKYIGKEDFIVHAGDAAIIGKIKHPVLRLIETATKDSSISAVLLFKKVKDARRYGVPEIIKISDGIYNVQEIEEKPLKPKFKIGLLPIYYFKSNIFKCIKEIHPGKNNEIQLTDAIRLLIKKKKRVVAIPLDKSEFELDVGTIESYRFAQKISYRYL